MLRENFKSYYWRVSFATKVYPSAVGLSTLYVAHKSLWFLIYYYHYLAMPHSMDCVLIGRIFFFFSPREGRIYYLQQERRILAFPKQCLWLVGYSEYIKGIKVFFFFFNIYLLILFWAVWSLCCGAPASCVGGFSCRGAQGRGHTGFSSCMHSLGSVLVACRLRCSAARGIFPSCLGGKFLSS